MTERRTQLTIPLTLPNLYRLEEFDVGGNGELLARLGAVVAGSGTPGLWIWGPPGSGRSHLLQGACHAAEARGARARYLPLADVPRRPEVLDGHAADLVAVDDVDGWLGEPELEAALMALYQLQLDDRASLLVSAADSAARLTYALADLGSRFRALPALPVTPPDDAGLRRILTAKAHLRGLTLSEGVLDYWLHRASRSLPVLLGQLEVLDARALSEQRRITVPLLKAELSL